MDYIGGIRSRYRNRDGTPTKTMLQNYNIRKQNDQAKVDAQANKPFAFSDEYKAAQGEREAAIKAQFGAAQRGLMGKEAVTKDEISTGLNRLTARVGAVGGSVEKARQKAINETSKEYAGQYQDLAANEAAATSALKGEDAARMIQGEQFNKQFDLQKQQFAEQMSFNYKELDENLKTNMLNAITTMKKAGINDKNMSKLYGVLNATYGDQRTSSYYPLARNYEARRRAAADKNMTDEVYNAVYGT